MKRTIFITGLISLTVMLFSSCIIIDGDGSTYNTFNSSLRGTWETQPGSYGNYLKLEIDYNTITITGGGNPQPLSGINRNFKLSGYSEGETGSTYPKEGSIYIKDKGSWSNPITYVLWQDGSYIPKQALTLRGNFSIYDVTFVKSR